MFFNKSVTPARLSQYLASRVVRNSTTTTSTTTDYNEVRHHENQSENWWNPSGPMAALHALNEIRVPFIRDGLVARGQVNADYINTTNVLQDQKMLEVGCGGGLLTEQLGRLGADITGIDLGERLIQRACKHLNESSPELVTKVKYRLESVDQHAKAHGEFYTAVIVSEVLEHVDDKVGLLEACVRSLKPGGSIFITTINKTLPMWIGGVLIGEYVLNLAPKGTHHWDKMISPLDVQRILDTMNCQTVLINGSTYDFWRNTWRWINSTQMCYALQAVKQT
ncbi:ubiquinone biosynthesis O-methyltransferase, mitochondrial [Drosophila willistoni]|uniref:ubiquinone biosynthesis O-methyltransferase, mitochondrial n=1 Tax=Drosophila willistoni TaxID=7260 RepID=UPI001F083EC6|nr:ubiquinone biosynthesis O-methyltransferase, mitochondrial [Drosophila willistoni]